jgi:hypothetical protein
LISHLLRRPALLLPSFAGRLIFSEQPFSPLYISPPVFIPTPPSTLSFPKPQLIFSLEAMRLDAFQPSIALSLLLTVGHALAVPTSRDQPSSRSLHVPILRRVADPRNDTEWGLWAKQQKEFLEGKYNRHQITKRSSGYNLCAPFPFLLVST